LPQLRRTPHGRECAAPGGEGDAGKVGGFLLHAGVAAEAHESQKLVRLSRHIARPAISEKRLSISPQGTALPAEDAVEERHYARGLRAGGLDGAHPCAPPCGRPAVVQIGNPADSSSPSWPRWCRHRVRT